MRSKLEELSDLTPVGKLAEAGMHQIIGYQLAQATIAATQSFMAHVGTPFELRPVEFTILALVDENPGVSAKRLAQALAVTAPNITMWTERLEARKLIARERNQTDRRAQHIRTTALGSKIVRKAVKLLTAGEKDQFAALSAAERAILIELLHKLARCRNT